LRKTVKRKGVAHVVLTGGTVASEVHRAVSSHPQRDSVDWSAVHLWWGDERFVPAGDDHRNELHVTNDLLGALALTPGNIHRMPASDAGLSLTEAAASYEAELARCSGVSGPWPDFDIAFAGVGPDGHVLSVFPGSAQASMAHEGVVAVDNSPKPPAERLTMTLSLLNRSQRVWLVAAGADKAPAIGLALADAHVVEVPAAGLSGTQSTKVFIDSELAAGVPHDLVARQRFWSADDERADYVPNALR